MVYSVQCTVHSVLCTVTTLEMKHQVCAVWCRELPHKAGAAESTEIQPLPLSIAKAIQYQVQRYELACKGNPTFESNVEGKS